MTTAPTDIRNQGVSMLGRMTQLDNMVAQSITAKAAKAAGPPKVLTPLTGEASTTLVATVASLIPNHPVLGSLADDPDIILGRLADVRRQLDEILASVGRLEVMYGKPAEALAAVAVMETALTETEKARREQDRKDAASAGPTATKADKAKAARAAARIAAEAPIIEPTVRVDAKAELLKQLLDEPDAIITHEFAADFAAKSAAAQAATFSTDPGMQRGLDGDESPMLQAAKAAADAGGGPAEVMAAAMAAEGWVCPVHGGGKIGVRKSPRRQVEFHHCAEPGCPQFEHV